MRMPALRASLVALLAAVVVGLPSSAAPAEAATTYLLMPRSELLSRPTSGAAWSALKAKADATLGAPNLCDQNSQHNIRTLANALVYARTGNATYRTRARNGIMAAPATQKVGCGNATLALGRQLGSYVLAADLIDLAGSDDSTFRSWLSGIRTKTIGGHSVWTSLRITADRAPNNWGGFAQASLTAADLYLGDTTGINRDWARFRGFTGDRSAFTFPNGADGDHSWECGSGWTPMQLCSGNARHGAIAEDAERDGAYPALSRTYQQETMQGLAFTAELLQRNGKAAWTRLQPLVTFAHRWSNWNVSTPGKHLTWWFNVRLGAKAPTVAATHGRIFGFTDWLYGGASVPTPAPAAPTSSTPAVALYRTTSVPTRSVPIRVAWGSGSAPAGVSRYQLQLSVDGGTYRSLSLSSARARSRTLTAWPGHTYRFRTRIVDRLGRASAWAYSRTTAPRRVQETTTAAKWAGTWRRASSTSYLGGAVRWSRTKGSTVTFTFTGSSVAWVGPVGPTRGKATISLDGRYVGTVDLYASRFRARKVIYAVRVTPGTHVLRIKVAGTAGRPTVAIDAFYVLR